jgi:two-component system sensor histidine kinase YesM
VYEPVSGEFLGVLVVDCEPGLFNLDAVNTLPELILFSVENTDTGYILYTNVDELLRKSDIDQMNVGKAKLHYDNIVLTALVNYPQLYRQFSSTQQVIVVIGVVCAVAFFILSMLFSNGIAKPITNISRQMADRSGHNKVSNEKYLKRRDEVGVLCNEYNALLDELERTVVSEYQHRLIMLDAQMRSLEAQIDSHFLYNTLESINSIAEIEHVESIATISQALGNMFRYSIKTKSELVTVEDELGHVGDYVSIQQIRFDNAFRLELKLSDELRKMRILKLIMQPLVENAIKHGLRNCQSGDCISIAGSFDNELITLSVEDNGTGMSEEQIAILRESLALEPHFSELGQRDSASIGLKNIQSRIELYYGKGHGLSISSSHGRGTRVTVSIPYIQAV